MGNGLYHLMNEPMFNHKSDIINKNVWQRGHTTMPSIIQSTVYKGREVFMSLINIFYLKVDFSPQWYHVCRLLYRCTYYLVTGRKQIKLRKAMFLLVENIRMYQKICVSPSNSKTLNQSCHGRRRTSTAPERRKGGNGEMEEREIGLTLEQRDGAREWWMDGGWIRWGELWGRNE